MFNVTTTFLSKIVEPSRVLRGRVDINGTVVDDAIISSFEVENSIGSDKMPTIGGSVAGKLNLTLINDVSLPAILIGIPIKPYVDVETSTGVYESVPLGVFYAKQGDVVRNKQTITIECFDKMPDMDAVQYDSLLTFPATIQDMLGEIATKYGIVFEAQTLDAVSFPTKPSGTVRRVLTEIASLLSKNVRVNRLGKFEFVFTNVIPSATFTFNSNNYITFSLLSDSMVRISQLRVTREDGTELISGNNTGLSVLLENPAIVDAVGLDTVLNRVYPLDFHAYSMPMQGMPHLDVGDIVTFTDINSVVRTIIIADHKVSYNGGLRSEVGCNAPKADTTEINVTSGSTVGNSLRNYSKTVKEAIDNATKLITGANGGNVIIVQDKNGKPVEIIISSTEEIDSPDAEVWRWNRNGLGFSSTGYNGTFSIAMTSDGQIVADFITAGELNADIVKTGRLQAKQGNAWIDLESGAFSFGAGGLSIDNTNGLMLNGESLANLLNGKVDSSWKEEFNTYIGFSETVGLVIGDAVTENKIQIKGGSISFFDESNTMVAEITGNKLRITNAEISSTFVINKHQFKRYNDDVTIVTWIG